MHDPDYTHPTEGVVKDILTGIFYSVTIISAVLFCSWYGANYLI